MWTILYKPQALTDMQSYCSLNRCRCIATNLCLYTWELTEYACCFSSVPQWSSHCVWCQVRPTTSELLSLTKPTDINLACQISLVTNPTAPRRADYNFTR
uniref:Uncharacterized protein n=1 Tax=Zea mays TaxID=4577 RepID=C4J165_MAIZE|nr:unknown [Zea mays]